MDLIEKSTEPSGDSAASSRNASFDELPDEASDPPQDRRIHPRFSVDGDSTLLLVSHGLSLPSRILDLSLEGCRLRTRERYAVAARARVEVAFKVNGIAFRFLGVIQWTDGRHCAGIRFVDMIARRREELAEVIGEIESVTAAKAAKAAAELKAVAAAREVKEAAEFKAQNDAQAAEKPNPVKGTGFSPYINQAISERASAPEGVSSRLAIFRSLLTLPPPSQNSPRPQALHQGTTSAVPYDPQNSPRPEVMYQGTTSVVPQTLPYQHRALAPAESSVRAMPSLESTRQTADDPVSARAAELAAWEAREWAEIQQLEHTKVEATPKVAQLPHSEAAQPSQSPSQAPTKRDRRAQSRHPVDTTAAILLIKIGSRLGGRIIDLSAGGCRILCDERFPVGIYTRVETEFRLEGLPFRLGGVIQAIHDRRTVGIRFLDMSGRKREQIEQLIEEIEEAHAMPPAVAEPTINGPS